MNWEHPDVQTGFRQGRGTRDQIAYDLPTLDHRKSKRISEKHLLLLHWLWQNICVDHNKLWKILKAMGIPDHLTCLLRNLYGGQGATVRTRHGTMDWFKIDKGVLQGYILSPCLSNLYMQSTSCEMPGWMKLKQASRLPGEISTTSDMQMTLLPLWQKVKRNWTASWRRWKRRVKKLALNLTFRKWRSWHLVPSLHGKYWAEWITSWNQDYQEKYQQPQI